ncbi:MAG: hypothetical protein AB1491_12845 [Thermodesulfobacteriota bacterium]
MKRRRAFFSQVLLDGHPLAAYREGKAPLQDRYLLKDYLEYLHIKKGLLEPYSPAYPLVEPRELLPSFEKNFAEYKDLPCFSLIALNRTLAYQEEIFQFDLLHSLAEGRKKALRENLDKIMPHLDRDLRLAFKQRFANRDLTDLARYEELADFLFHMDRAQVIARDEAGDFRLLGVYASFPSDLDTELKNFGRQLGKFKKLDSATYEQERYFVYQFLMELYGFPIAAERRTSAALFARRLSRHKEQYLIKVLGSADRTITSLCGFDQKKYPLVEKMALISLPAALVEAHPHLLEEGYLVDPARRVVILKVTYQQHKYNRFNVLEDRALSVVKQEIIHPFHGGRETGLNILKDTRRVLKDLQDIVRGEYSGTISYQRTELLTSTKTHEDRLKFLSAWLTKNQRRLAAYSQEFFEDGKKMLNSYLLKRENKEAFAKHSELHREVLGKVAYLAQAQQLQTLERLVHGQVGRRQMGPYPRIAQAVAFLEDKKEELPYFYPDLFAKCRSLWEQLLNYPYFKRLREMSTPPPIPYRHRVWQMLILGRRLMEEMVTQHQQVQTAVSRGTPFPLLAPEAPRRPAPPGP